MTRSDNANPLTAGRDVSRDRDLGWVAATIAGDLCLSAGDVELGSTSNVETNLLNADEVLEKGVSVYNGFTRNKDAHLARGSGGRDGGRQGACAVRAELEWVEGGAPLGDLEPVGTAAVPRRDAAWGLAEVNRRRAGVIEGVVKLEANGAACGDGDNLASGAGAGVAANVVGVDACNGAVVDGLTDGGCRRTAGGVEGCPDI